MSNKLGRAIQSGGVNVEGSKLRAKNVVGRDLIENLQVYVNSGAEAARPATPLEVISRMQEARELDRKISSDAQYYVAKLGMWPQSAASGQEMVQHLRALLKNVESSEDYCANNRHIWGTLYRMLAGAYMIHESLDLGEKLHTVIPILKQSEKIWPDQKGLANTIAFFDQALASGKSQITDYLTNVFQILRGPDDPEIPGLVETLATGAQSPERQAQSWLLNHATPNPIWNLLLALQAMMKNERGIEAEIEIRSERMPNGHVSVEAKVGPNVLLWEVDHGARTFVPTNQLTSGFMSLIAGA